MDDIDKVSCRPDFAVLVYPGYLATKEKDGLNPDIRVTDKTPPMFLAHASNDGVPAENSVQMYLALKKAGVKAGVANGHHLVNKSKRDAVYLEVGTRAKRERAHYPDVDLVYEKDESGFRFSRRSGEPYPKNGG